MGTMRYDDNPASTISMTDDELAHIKRIVSDRFRRRESMMFSWADGDGKSRSVWLHPAVTLSFAFDGIEPVALDRSWLDLLASAAYSIRGLAVLPQPAPRDGPAEAPAVELGLATGRAVGASQRPGYVRDRARIHQ